MDTRLKSFAKLAVRLVGVTFGLAVALFLFSSVAFGHSYSSHMDRYPVRSYTHHTRYRHYQPLRYNNRNWQGHFGQNHRSHAI
jgi:hypothetical protein